MPETSSAAPSAATAGLTLTVSKTFTFEAAHRFEHEDAGHPFSRLHGHSFEGVVTLAGPADAAGGFIQDLWAVDGVVKNVVAEFDHAYLNDIPDLPTPSLENLAMTLFARFEPKLPGLVSVEVRRPSCGEAARVSKEAAS